MKGSVSGVHAHHVYHIVSEQAESHPDSRRGLYSQAATKAVTHWLGSKLRVKKIMVLA